MAVFLGLQLLLFAYTQPHWALAIRTNPPIFQEFTPSERTLWTNYDDASPTVAVNTAASGTIPHPAAAAGCPPGQAWDQAAGACALCPAGSYSRGGSLACVKCLKYYTTVGPGATSANECLLCAPGYATPMAAHALVYAIVGVPSCVCERCPRRYYSAGGTPPLRCQLCPQGWTTPNRPAASKKDCTIKAQNSTSTLSAAAAADSLDAQSSTQPVQTICDPGTYWSEEASTCSACRKGTFSFGGSARKCSPCHAAYTTAGKGAASPFDCSRCKPGYGRQANAPSCVCSLCPKGSWSAGDNPTPQPCTRCPTNWTTNGTRSTSKDACSLPDIALFQKQALLQGLDELDPDPQDSWPQAWRHNPDMCKWAYPPGEKSYNRGSAFVECNKDGLVQFLTIMPAHAPRGRLPKAWGALGASFQEVYIYFDPPEVLQHPEGGMKNSSLSEPTFPREWSVLTGLTSIYIRGIGLSGPVPLDVLSSSKGLVELTLEFNMFSSLPDVPAGSYPALSMLNLQHNLLAGTLHEGYSASFPALQELNLDYNMLSGPLPETWWASWSLLYKITISRNNIAGTLPDSLASLHPTKEALHLDLSYNKIGGQLPLAWADWDPNGPLGIPLNLAHNEITGPLPAVAPYTKWPAINLSFNKLTGTLPEIWWQWKENIMYLDLSYNYLKGPLPAVYSNWATTYGYLTLNLASNPLGTTLPPEWSSWESLDWLYMHNCSLKGTFSPYWDGVYMFSLYAFSFHDNPELGGCLPFWINSPLQLNVINTTCVQDIANERGSMTVDSCVVGEYRASRVVDAVAHGGPCQPCVNTGVSGICNVSDNGP